MMWGGMIYKYSESQHTTISNLRSKTYLVNLDSVAFQVVLVVKNLLDNANAGDVRDTGLIPGLGRSPGGGNGNPLLYSCLENSMDRGAWRATHHVVTKSWTQLKRLSTHTPFNLALSTSNLFLILCIFK